MDKITLHLFNKPNMQPACQVLSWDRREGTDGYISEGSNGLEEGSNGLG